MSLSCREERLSGESGDGGGIRGMREDVADMGHGSGGAKIKG